jgi:hypothetical protein
MKCMEAVQGLLVSVQEAARQVADKGRAPDHR